MREILFRGKSVIDNEWICGSLVKTDDNYNEPLSRRNIKQNIKICHYVAGDWGLGGWCFDEVMPETIGQFTGLSDNNGVKIFEGDVVLANGWKSNLKHDFSSARRFVSATIKDIYERTENRTKYEVYWQQCFSQFEFRSLEDSSINPSITERELEVIGNIHDNPELLK